jgi:hypothetical protein
MTKKILEVENTHQEGAKLNLTIDIAPADCFLMCKELFFHLKEHEKKELIQEFLKGQTVEVPDKDESNKDSEKKRCRTLTI